MRSATEKQKAYAKVLDVELPENCSIEEASEIIADELEILTDAQGSYEAEDFGCSE